MCAARPSERRLAWWICSAAAMALHGAVVLALPDAPIRQQSAASDIVSVSWAVVPSQRLAGGSLRDSHAVGTARMSGQAHAEAAARTRAPRAPSRQPRSAACASDEPAHATADALPQPLVASASISSAASSLGLPSSTAGDDASGTPAAAGSPGEVLPSHGEGAFSASRAPSLIATRNPCSGYFPANARADHGRVQIHVGVDAAGHAGESKIVVESPGGQEFGSAARACAAALHFVPAADPRGAPIAGVAKLELRFDRT